MKQYFTPSLSFENHSKRTKRKLKEKGRKCALVQVRGEREDSTEIEIGNERNKETNGKKLLNSQTQLIIVVINAKKERRKIGLLEGEFDETFTINDISTQLALR